MTKLTKAQRDLVSLYADRCATFKKYWIVFMIGGSKNVCQKSEARDEMVEWAYDAYDCAKALGLDDDEILKDIIWCIEDHPKSNAFEDDPIANLADVCGKVSRPETFGLQNQWGGSSTLNLGDVPMTKGQRDHKRRKENGRYGTFSRKGRKNESN